MSGRELNPNGFSLDVRRRRNSPTFESSSNRLFGEDKFDYSYRTQVLNDVDGARPKRVQKKYRENKTYEGEIGHFGQYYHEFNSGKVPEIRDPFRNKANEFSPMRTSFDAGAGKFRRKDDSDDDEDFEKNKAAFFGADVRSRTKLPEEDYERNKAIFYGLENAGLKNYNVSPTLPEASTMTTAEIQSKKPQLNLDESVCSNSSKNHQKSTQPQTVMDPSYNQSSHHDVAKIQASHKIRDFSKFNPITNQERHQYSGSNDLQRTNSRSSGVANPITGEYRKSSLPVRNSLANPYNPITTTATNTNVGRANSPLRDFKYEANDAEDRELAKNYARFYGVTPSVSTDNWRPSAVQGVTNGTIQRASAGTSTGSSRSRRGQDITSKIGQANLATQEGQRIIDNRAGPYGNIVGNNSVDNMASMTQYRAGQGNSGRKSQDSAYQVIFSRGGDAPRSRNALHNAARHQLTRSMGTEAELLEAKRVEAGAGAGAAAGGAPGSRGLVQSQSYVAGGDRPAAGYFMKKTLGGRFDSFDEKALEMAGHKQKQQKQYYIPRRGIF
mmetsp:Transcript_20994/g.23746  ORF Transcript_20994/g.23746 Transcript_20994/m.23746 type:complete len:554 (+) Transcript_20994:55-1716(+)